VARAETAYNAPPVLSLLLAAALSAPPQTPAAPPLAAREGAAPAAWQLVLATEGGPSGRGRGGLEFRSSGAAYITPPLGARCELRASPRELEAVAAAVRGARPRAWRPRYVRASNPEGCCGLLAFLLELNLGTGAAEKRHGTGWFEDSRGMVPVDARRLHSAAQEFMDAHPCPAR
jgi:hypothetical protein